MKETTVIFKSKIKKILGYFYFICLNLTERFSLFNHFLPSIKTKWYLHRLIIKVDFINFNIGNYLFEKKEKKNSNRNKEQY